ncbi:MAG: hypothetical protein ABUL44_01415, partial [Flavobacterium sp.]
ENIYDGYNDYQTQTYDGHEDNAVFEPTELKLSITDKNNDGYKDMVFSGKIVLTQANNYKGLWYDMEVRKNQDTIFYSAQHPFKKIPVAFIFLYNKSTGHFEAKEDYDKKYEQYY